MLNLEHTPPLGKVAAVFLVLRAAFRETVQALGGALVGAAGKWDNSLVNLEKFKVLKNWKNKFQRIKFQKLKFSKI